jgi:hypothetical protein
MAIINELIIRISEGTDEPGYFYDIYDTADVTDDDVDSVDGGFCTSTIENALDMAVEQAKEIIKNSNP